MASTKLRKAEYSRILDNMTSYIHRYFELNSKEKSNPKIHKAVYDFCYKYPPKFQKEFIKRISLRYLKYHKNKNIDVDFLLSKFLGEIKKIKGECVFLLKDTYDILNLYQNATGKGFGILINRDFLGRNEKENDYFYLIKLIYDSLNSCKNFKEFSKKYFQSFQKLINGDLHFLKKSEQIADYVKKHASEKKITFVDMGFQGTFALFCWASIKFHSEGHSSDIYLFSVYPWLAETYKEKYYSDENEVVLNIELSAIENFTNDIKSKAAAATVGFAIGDSLGFPMAGIDKRDRQKFLKGEIKYFTANPRHPFFSHLKKGEYTDNTNLLILSAKHLLENKKIDIKKYSKELANWFKKIHGNKNRERWLGPTTSGALCKFIKTGNYKLSGSKTSDSCASTYRVVPLGIFFRPFFKNTHEELKIIAERSSMITHNSEISKTGAMIVALIVSDLMHKINPEKAVKSAITMIKINKHNLLLIAKIEDAMKYSKSKDIDFARKYFGTGSSIYQTLPLAIFFLLKFQNNFEKAVIAAANSYRDDNKNEKKRLTKFSWQEQMFEANGGNTDGIAALTGAFVGAHLGMEAIPKRFLSIENGKKLEKIGYSLMS